MLLGSAAGVLFGLSAALTKVTVERLDEGVLHVLADWHLWALIVVGYAGTAFAQSSLQTGALGPAVATQTVFDPLASLLLGTLVLGEHVHDTALGAAGTLAAVVAMVGGTAALALAEGGQRTDAAARVGGRQPTSARTAGTRREPDHRQLEDALDARVQQRDLGEVLEVLGDDRARHPLGVELRVEVAQRGDLEVRVERERDPALNPLDRAELRLRVEQPAPGGEVQRQPRLAALAQRLRRVDDQELRHAVGRVGVVLHEVERPALVAAGHEAQEAERPAVLVVGRDGEQQVGVLTRDAAAQLHREAALGRAGAPALAHLFQLGAQSRRRVGLAEEAEVALRPDAA